MCNNIKYSIILATFNGEKYIIQQLDSIKNQTLRASEVLIFDDCSTDNTVGIIKKYILENELEWIVEVNTINLGWKKNFIYGITKAKFSLVFLCDQDDIWEKDKCELMVCFMNKTPDCDLLMSNYDPFTNSESIHIPFRMYLQRNDRKFIKVQPKAKFFVHTFRPGCSYCLKKSFFDEVKFLWYEGIPHDAFIYHLSLIFNSSYLFRYKAIQFRRHENNNSPKNIRTVDSRLSEIENLLELFNKYQQELHKLAPSDMESINSELDKVVRYLEAKCQYYSSPTFIKWLALIIHNHSSYSSLINIFGDLYIGLRSSS